MELSLFKVYKGDEEMFLEQMLVQSLVNLEIESLRKHFKPFRFNITSQYHNKELGCLGFKVDGFDLFIKKGAAQVDLKFG